jgi:FkbM family methyltransferase
LAKRSIRVVWYLRRVKARSWLDRVARALQPRRLRARLAAHRVPLDRADLSEAPATLEDVYRCYRLLLRRNPDPTGFWAYADKVADGISVQELVSYFVGSPEWVSRGLYRAAGDAHLERVETEDVALYVSKSDPVVGRELLVSRAYEPHVAKRLRECLLPGSVFVDVGANIGYYALLAARRVGREGRVIAFEPNPESLKVLLLNTLPEGDTIRVYPFAVSDREGFLSLMRIVSIASTKPVAEAELRYPSDVVLTYAVRLDDWLRDERRIDVLKCDIDGHDYRAIRGGLATLARTRPVVFAEFNPGTLRSFSEVEPAEYLKLFTALDYRITILLRRRDPIPCGQDAGRVMTALEAAGLDQVDLMLTPPAAAGRLGSLRGNEGA